jgi:hypothetical protein
MRPKPMKPTLMLILEKVNAWLAAHFGRCTGDFQAAGAATTVAILGTAQLPCGDRAH